jgi:hypothetical protein
MLLLAIYKLPSGLSHHILFVVTRIALKKFRDIHFDIATLFCSCFFPVPATSVLSYYAIRNLSCEQLIMQEPSTLSLMGESLEEISHYYALNQDVRRVIFSLPIVHLEHASSCWAAQEICNA